MRMVLLTALGIGGATIIGAAIGFLVKNVSHKVNDMILSFAAGIMLAAAVGGLVVPAFELVSGVQLLIPVAGIFAGALFLSDFNKYFTLFHEIFFTNDLWLLDPRTDLLIRMLPEGFFFDMVVRIGSIFLILLSLGVVISIITLSRHRNKNN